MKRILIAVAFAAIIQPAFGQTSKLIQAQNAIPGRYIVVFKDNAAVSAASATQGQMTVSSLVSEVSSVHGGEITHVYEHALKGYAARMSEAQAQALAADERVAFVEEDGIMTISDTRRNATWGLDRIDQRNLPLDTNYTFNVDGSGVHVYIVDTGIRASHGDFGGRFGNGFTAINDGRDTDDCNGHGTHVAGTVGGKTWGVADNVTLHAVRVLGCKGTGPTSGVVNGVEFVAKNVTENDFKLAVANLSLGGGASTAIDNAVRNSIDAGVTYVVAAGNAKADACNSSPARVAEAITVGASTRTDSRATSFSNFGRCVQIFAPGEGITSAWIRSDSDTNTISGTSMATPHVAGAAALFLEANPDATPAQVMEGLRSNATPNKLRDIGAGSPNLLLFTLTGDVVDSPPTASFTFQCNDLSCQFDGSGSSDDRGIASYQWNFGDNAAGSGQRVGHSYGAAGTFNVTLVVRDTAGQTGRTSRAVTVTDGGGPGPCTDCERFTGTLIAGTSAFQPNGRYYRAGAGTHRGILQGPAGANFDLELFQFSFARLRWVRVAASQSAGPNEEVSFNGSVGYYLWRIRAVQGSGSYQFFLKRP